MTCKGCNRAVYDTDVDQDGLCCFCSPAGEKLTGTRPPQPGAVGQAADFGEGTPVNLHGVETVPVDDPEEPKKRPRRRGSVIG